MYKKQGQKLFLRKQVQGMVKLKVKLDFKQKMSNEMFIFKHKSDLYNLHKKHVCFYNVIIHRKLIKFCS